MILTGSSASLVPLDRRHLTATRAWANDWEIAEFMDRATPVSDAAHERWYEAIENRADCVYFAIEANDESATSQHIGNVWLWDIDTRHRKAEVRIVIGARNLRSQGIGTDALDLVSRYAFRRLNLRRLYAFVLSSNTRAVKAFEKAGFQQEGLLRGDRWSGEQYVDVVSLARMREAERGYIPTAHVRARLGDTIPNHA